MKKIFTLCFMAVALLASAKTYTLSELATLVPALEDGTGVTVADGAYIINLPASLPEGVSGLGYDDNNIVLTKTYFTINGDLVISEGETLLFGGSSTMEINGNLTITGGNMKLSNLVWLIDFNGLQIDGPIAEVMNPTPYDKKFEAFGWNVVECDAHDFDSIEAAYKAARECTDKPTVIISHSTKGKGVSFMENNVAWHGAAPNAEQYEVAMADLGER